MARYLIIADDFTGANDTGVQLKKRGVPVRLLLRPEEKGRQAGQRPESEVNDHVSEADGASVVLVTETRNLGAAEAAAKIRTLTQPLLGQADFTLIYKKVDSTLRGNIREELSALYEIYRPDRILFAPAYPAIGRVTHGGIHHLEDTPLLQTEFARDPLKPLFSDRLEDYLQGVAQAAAAAEAGGRADDPAIARHSLADIRSGEISLDSAVCHCFDVQDQADLQKIAELGLQSAEKILWVGSAGLAEALFARLHPAKPVLSVVGSLSEKSLAQVNYAVKDQSGRKGHDQVCIAASDFVSQVNLESYRDQVLACLNAGSDCIIRAFTCRDDLAACRRLGQEMNLDNSSLSARLLQYLGRLTRAVIERCRPAGLFLTGGDTALAVLEHLEADGNEIVRELETGVVLTKLCGGPFAGLNCVTKAGAFGTEETLVRAAEQMKEEIE